MRVIAGSARGIRLAAPRGMGTRPTADRVREALFSIILSMADLEGKKVLDICAGTGSLGIEALSRGAESCCFIENDRNAAAIIAKNLLAVRCSGQADILETDALKALRILSIRGMQFDVVFFDPPYSSKLYETVPVVLCEQSLLKADALLVVEVAARNKLPERFGNLIRNDRRVYGDTALEFFILEE